MPVNSAKQLFLQREQFTNFLQKTYVQFREVVLSFAWMMYRLDKQVILYILIYSTVSNKSQFMKK